MISPASGAPNGFVTNVVYSPDGRTTVSASSDQTIKLWDAVFGKVIRALKGHSSSVLSVVLSPDGRTIASASYDNTIRLWDLHFYQILCAGGKPKPLFYTFSEGVNFFWDMKLEGMEFKKIERQRTLFVQDGYHFVYNKKYRPLLDPPKPGQTKYEQILEWAIAQQKKR